MARYPALLTTLLTLCFCCCTAGKLEAQNWPQPLGPKRDCKASQTLPDDWTVDQMKQAWSLPAGQGFAGPIIVDGNAILFDRQDKQLRLQAVRLQDGKPVWQREVAAVYPGGFDPDKGPRATPVLADNKIFAWSAGGILICVSAKDGSLIWQKNLAKEFPGGEGYFGFGGGPLVIGNTVIINIGSRKAAVVGLETMTGQVRWTAAEDQASYAAPVSATIAGKEVALLITRLNFLILDPADGSIIGRTEFGKRGATVNAASPVLLPDQKVFLNAAYGIGSKTVALPANTNRLEQELPIAWEDATAFASQYTTPVLVEGHLYGTSGREDFDDAQLRCIRASDGKVIWNEPDWPLAHSILVGDRLLLLTLDCRLVVGRPSTDRWEKKEEKVLATGATRPLPALGNNHLIFRTIASPGQPARWIAYRLTESVTNNQ